MASYKTSESFEWGYDFEDFEDAPVGTSLVHMPAEIADMQRQLHDELMTFDHDVVANAARLGSVYVTAWKNFINSYGDWYASTSGWTDRLSGSVVTTVETYRARYQDFARQFAVIMGRPPSVVPGPMSGDATSRPLSEISGIVKMGLAGFLAYLAFRAYETSKGR